jgi:thymidine kinase
MADSRTGGVELICGCMFSGKTERLVERLQQAAREKIPARAFKHASDVRYAGRELASHSGRHCDATPVATAEQILELANTARLIVIDEGQFFGPELIDVCRELARQGRHVVVAALDRDSWGQPFGPIPQLREIADEVIYTKGRCACGAEAEFTQRLAPVAGQTMIGGPESYTACCARCFQAPPAELRR